MMASRLTILTILQGIRFKENKAACRYIIVDAYNSEGTLRFYTKNGFKPLYKTADAEKVAFGISESEDLKSRIFFFDLKLIS